MPTLWIVCPVYQDVASFIRLREHLLDQAKNLKEMFSQVCFVVIDDSAGSDSEVELLRSMRDTSVIVPHRHLGHQQALVFGLRALAKKIHDSDTLITLDADGEDKPEDLPRLLAASAANPQSIALAYRTRREETWKFKLLYFLFKLFFRLCAGIVIRTGNYAAYRGALLKKIISHPHFDLSYSSALLALHLEPAYVPCARGKRYFGRSKMTHLELVHHGIRMLMPFSDRIAARALLLCVVFLAAVVLRSFLGY